MMRVGGPELDPAGMGGMREDGIAMEGLRRGVAALEDLETRGDPPEVPVNPVTIYDLQDSPNFVRP
jgi:hypothetical protein